MAEEIQAMMALFNYPEHPNNKKNRTKKEIFLLKFQLFTVIYQKKGSQNFSEIVARIRIAKYGFAWELYRDGLDRFFTYVITGTVLVFVNRADEPLSAPTLYQKMGANEHFGQKIYFGHNQKLHSAKSVSNSTYVFELDLETFYKTFSGHFKYQELKQKVDFLSNIWLFKNIRQIEIERILLLSKPHRFTKNSVVFKEGETPEFLYIVIQGEMTLYKRDSQLNRHLPFMILGKDEVYGCQQILNKGKFECGGVITSSTAVLFKISSKLFIDVFANKVDSNIMGERTEVKEKLIEAKSKESITTSLRKLYQNEAKQTPDYRGRKLRCVTSNSQAKPRYIFSMSQMPISKQAALKNSKLRQYTLADSAKSSAKPESYKKLHAATSYSFHNDKQVLLSCLMRKQRRQQKAEQKEKVYQEAAFFPLQQLVVEQSSAVRNQKRRLKQSRKRNTSSMPCLS